MKSFDKLYIDLKRKAARDAERKTEQKIHDALGKMPKEHLTELLYGEPSDDRVKEIFASVGGIHLLESG